MRFGLPAMVATLLLSAAPPALAETKAPTFVPDYARARPSVSQGGGWARSPAALAHQMRSEMHWHKGNVTAMATRLASRVGPGARDEIATVRVGELQPVHSITPGDAQLASRVEQLKTTPPKIFGNSFSIAEQQRYFSAVTPIRVVRDTKGKYYVLDGNLRSEALKHVLGPSATLDVKVINADSKVVSALVHHLVRVRGMEDVKSPDRAAR